MNSPASYYESLATEYLARRDRLMGILTSAGFRCFKPRGAYYIMTDISAFGFPDDVTFAKYLVTEIGVELPPGRLMGELGFLTPNNRRTATVECTENGHVLTITYEKLLEIYFQNQQFGYYFLVLTSQRLLENIARLEGIIAQAKIAPQAAATPG